MFLIGITQVAALGVKLTNFAEVWASETPSDYQTSVSGVLHSFENCADDTRCPAVGAAMFFYLCGFIMSLVCAACAFLKAQHRTATRRC